MPELVAPTVDVHTSFLDAMTEFREEGRGSDSDDSMVGREIREWSAHWSAPAGFAEYVGVLRAAADEQTPRPPTMVASTTLWWIEGDEYLGRLAIRHRLTPRLLEFGGHIGYDVRRSARRRGHATAMLRAALPLAAGLGIDAALITCDTENLASRRVIESCGGVLEDEREGKLRYWVATR